MSDGGNTDQSSADERYRLYDDLHGVQLVQEEQDNLHSAARILDILLRYYRPNSILDVGCGLGTWLKAAQGAGIADVMGVDGNWLDVKRLQVSPERVRTLDLESPFDVGRKFDMAISLEVAEHLSPPAAEGFVASLVRHAPVVLFSAAIPFQGGHHHVNEQFPSYWADHFARFDFRPIDCIRGEIWDSPNVLWWLRQNTMIFAHETVIAGHEVWRQLMASRAPLSVVHPQLYLDGQQMRREYDAMTALLRPGGLFRSIPNGAGGFTLERAE